MTDPNALQTEKHEKANRDAVRFFLLFTGQGTPEIAASCLEALEAEVDKEPPKTTGTDAKAWHYLGQRELLRWLRRKIEMGERLANAT